MNNVRYSNAERTMIQAEDDAGNTLNIPVDARNAHYREMVLPWVAKGNTIAPFIPDPAAEAGARKAKLTARMLEALVDDANAGKSLDEIRADAKAAVDTKVGRL